MGDLFRNLTSGSTGSFNFSLSDMFNLDRKGTDKKRGDRPKPLPTPVSSGTSSSSSSQFSASTLPGDAAAQRTSSAALSSSSLSSSVSASSNSFASSSSSSSASSSGFDDLFARADAFVKSAQSTLQGFVDRKTSPGTPSDSRTPSDNFSVLVKEAFPDASITGAKRASVSYECSDSDINAQISKIATATVRFYSNYLKNNPDLTDVEMTQGPGGLLGISKLSRFQQLLKTELINSMKTKQFTKLSYDADGTLQPILDKLKITPNPFPIDMVETEIRVKDNKIGISIGH